MKGMKEGTNATKEGRIRRKKGYEGRKDTKEGRLRRKEGRKGIVKWRSDQPEDTVGHGFDEKVIRPSFTSSLAASLSFQAAPQRGN